MTDCAKTRETTAPAPAASAGLQRDNSRRNVLGRPWPKGVSGNPGGRRRGSVSLKAAVKRALTRPQADRLAQAILAKAGQDPCWARLLCELLDEVGPHSVATAVALAGQQAELEPMRVQIIKWPHEVPADESQRLGLGDGIGHGGDGSDADNCEGATQGAQQRLASGM